MIKFFVQTFGCQMNENDSERIAGIIRHAGGTQVEQAGEADLVVVNTCAVRQKSEEKLFSYIGRLGQLKKKKNLRVGVVGCVAQLRGLELLEEKSAVDFVLGPDNYAELPRLLRMSSTEKLVSTEWSEGWRENPPELVSRASRVSAFVTVMEGCDNFCAYCIVPFTRGREKCRPLSSILSEIQHLARSGFKEVKLLGQNVNTYNDPETGKSFADLLREVSSVEGISWVRFLTSHPKNFKPEIGEMMSAHRKICRQLHLPLQSGSSSILKKMKRGYTKEGYLGLVARLRGLMPEISLSTDIIVGYPGETEIDFEQTLEVLREVRFSTIFSFRYSPRPLTRASDLADDVPGEVKQRRLEAVQKLQREIQLEMNRSQAGRIQKVLCLGRGKRTPELFSGRNEANMVVNFFSGDDCIGDFVDVKITDCGPYSLRGEAVRP
jgi:tRNA-2-methylthio-N6-dimethylallyladenosine synthase